MVSLKANGFHCVFISNHVGTHNGKVEKTFEFVSGPRSKVTYSLCTKLVIVLTKAAPAFFTENLYANCHSCVTVSSI